MDSLIFENNRATSDIVSVYVLPYFSYRDIHVFSQINQDTTKYSHEAYINNLSENIPINYEKYHSNLIGVYHYGNNKSLHRLMIHLHGPHILERMVVDFKDESREISDDESLSDSTETSSEEDEESDRLNELRYNSCTKILKKCKRLIHLVILNSDCVIGDIAVISSLKYLSYLEYNIDDKFPNELRYEKLINLETLIISDTFKVRNCDFKFLIKLKHLELIGECNDIDDEAFTFLPNLESLTISNENITNIAIQSLPHLKHLHIRNNIIDNQAFINSSEMRNLFIDNVNITDEAILYMPKLEELEIHGIAKLTNEIFKYTLNLKSLHAIYIDITNETIRSLRNLSSLTIGSDLIDDTAFEYATKMKKLTITSKKLTNAAFKYMPNLERLIMWNNPHVTAKLFQFSPKIKYPMFIQCKNISLSLMKRY